MLEPWTILIYLNELILLLCCSRFITETRLLMWIMLLNYFKKKICYNANALFLTQHKDTGFCEICQKWKTGKSICEAMKNEKETAVNYSFVWAELQCSIRIVSNEMQSFHLLHVNWKLNGYNFAYSCCFFI